jgi:uncharacterized membrane protein
MNRSSENPHRMPGKRFLRQMREARLKERIFRWIGIGVIIFLVGSCVIVLAAFVWQFQVVVAAVGGVLTMAATFYLFIKLWPEETHEEPSVVSRSLEGQAPFSVETHRAPWFIQALFRSS